MITELNHDESETWIFDHNLDEYGLNIQDGYLNWYFRRDPDERTPSDLCEYLMSKNPMYLNVTHLESTAQ